MFEEVLANVLLVLLCYVYIIILILASVKLDRLLHISKKTSRKFLHAMIGNLPFVIPFFTSYIYPVLVAAPFIVITFLASPYTPFRCLSKTAKGLSEISEEGHALGLVFYAISYTVLAVFFASKPYIVAIGILPMAYGDSVASLVGERFGKIRYKLAAVKSLEGSVAMFVTSFCSLVVSLFFFSALAPFPVFGKILPALTACIVCTLAEGFSPMGFDNLTVPAFAVLTFLLSGGGS